MRIATGFCVMVVLLAGPLIPQALAAHPSAHGNIDFAGADGVVRSFHFNAKIDNQGNTDGDLTFVDPSATPAVDPDDPGGPTSQGVSLHVIFDCLIVGGNRAVMGGPVVDATFTELVGQRFLLTVEDNGEGNHPPPDRISWGLYANQGPTWTPSDAELESDDGASLTWLATDAERNDDVGVLTGFPTTVGQQVHCDSFPLSSYSLLDLDHHDGNIQVKN
jgi:hypothetical protein